MSTPRASRPYMPGYGIAPAKGGRGLLPWRWAKERLERGRAYFVSTAAPDGKPHVMPVWGVWFSDAFFFSTEELIRQLGGSFPSVRDTLVHIMAAEWIWLRRWKGVSPRALFNASEFPNLEAVKAYWSEIQTEQAAFVREVTDESLKEIIK